jgi:hypothetical protein
MQGFDMKNAIAAAFLLLASTVSFAAMAQDSSVSEGSNTSLPGSVFVVPPGGNAPEPEDLDDIVTDIDLFTAKGFKEPSWATHTAQVQDVLRDLVLPDWRKRTGKDKDPTLPSIDIAGESVLGGDYNDLLVVSRLPGDCDETGCLLQLYSLVNDVWVKRFEFKTVNFAWKPKGDDEVLIARVGGMWVPSATYLWKDGALHK